MSRKNKEFAISSFRPHDFWQDLRAPGGFAAEIGHGLTHLYPAALPDGREIALPIRVLPSGDRAVASLIVNQASFDVADVLAEVMSREARAFAPEVVVGVPTLGLPLAENVARRLGHSRMVALGTSRKFWYDDALSEPMRSITSPGDTKRIYLDPRMVPLLENRRFVVVDDVVSTGASLLAVLGMLDKAGLRPTAAIVAMLQGDAWREPLAASAHASLPVRSAIATPVMTRSGDGSWRPL